jgi:hypothetical protein
VLTASFARPVSMLIEQQSSGNTWASDSKQRLVFRVGPDPELDHIFAIKPTKSAVSEASSEFSPGARPREIPTSFDVKIEQQLCAWLGISGVHNRR